MNEQEITQTHFSENWAIEQVANYAARSCRGYASVPDILHALPPKHRRSAFNALRIAHTLHLISLEPDTNLLAVLSSEEMDMCPKDASGQPLVWARVQQRV